MLHGAEARVRPLPAMFAVLNGNTALSRSRAPAACGQPSPPTTSRSHHLENQTVRYAIKMRVPFDADHLANGVPFAAGPHMPGRMDPAFARAVGVLQGSDQGDGARSATIPEGGAQGDLGARRRIRLSSHGSAAAAAWPFQERLDTLLMQNEARHRRDRLRIHVLAFHFDQILPVRKRPDEMLRPGGHSMCCHNEVSNRSLAAVRM